MLDISSFYKTVRGSHAKAFFDRLSSILFSKDGHSASPQVPTYSTPEQLVSSLPDLSIQDAGLGEDELLGVFESLLQLNPDVAGIGYKNHMYGPASLPALGGALLGLMLKNSMATYESSPVFSLMEKELVSHYLELVGFDQGDGIFTSGGSNSNFVALLVARNLLYPTRETGVVDCGKQFSIFVSDQAHYSFKSAANQLGIGMDFVYPVVTDHAGKMSLDGLEEALALSRDRGETPLAVVATLGTSVLGACDPVDGIADIVAAYNAENPDTPLWSHVDGCFGTALLYMERSQSIRSAVSRYHSTCVNVHKVLGATLSSSVVLVNESLDGVGPRSLARACSPKGSEYLLHDIGNDQGVKSLFCGRSAAPVAASYMHMKALGVSGIRRMLEQFDEVTKAVTEYVRASSSLELILEPESWIVPFYFKPSDAGIDSVKFNETLRSELMSQGCVGDDESALLVNYGYFKGNFVFRPAYVNSTESVEQALSCIQVLESTGRRLESSYSE